jgi:integrase
MLAIHAPSCRRGQPTFGKPGRKPSVSSLREIRVSVKIRRNGHAFLEIGGYRKWPDDAIPAWPCLRFGKSAKIAYPGTDLLGPSSGMAVYKQKSSKNWWYKFIWNGEPIRESTKQTNKRVAEQMEAAHKAALAKGEVGIREGKATPTLSEFADQEFLPFVESRFANKPKTLEYYKTGTKRLKQFTALANSKLDAIAPGAITDFVDRLRSEQLQVSSINRVLEVLRRMLRLALEWGKVEKVPPKVQMLPGENERDRVLSDDEENRYLAAAGKVGANIEEAYRRALTGIRAQKGEVPGEPQDPYLLRDVTTILIDCGLRPEECFRLRWRNVRDGALHVPFGKTQNARRSVPLTPRAAGLLEMRCSPDRADWIFPAGTRSGHIEKSTLKKQHKKAIKMAKLEPFTLYTLRHTCLTRWAAHMDPYTLAYLAGHSDFSTTKRYVHPQTETVRAAMERVRGAKGGHSSGHSPEKPDQTPSAPDAVSTNDFSGISGRGEWIRTTDLLVPNFGFRRVPRYTEVCESHGLLPFQ